MTAALFQYRKYPMSETLHEALGAGPPAGVEQVTLFVPSVDRHGESIDQAYWSEQALTTFGNLFRGATAFPPGRGSGAMISERRVGVRRHPDGDVVRDRRDSRRPRGSETPANFLCRMGREADQGEVGIVIGGTYFGIIDYDNDGEA